MDEFKALQRKAEKDGLSAYSAFYLITLSSMIFGKIPSVVAILLLISLAGGWTLYFTKAGRFEQRALFTVIAANVCMVSTTFGEVYLLSYYITFIALIVITGFYSVENFVIVPAVSETVILFIQIFVTKKFSFGTLEAIIEVGLPLFLIYGIDGMVYLWIKKRNETQADLIAMIHELEKIEREKREFLKGVSHQIRTPINAICGMSEVLEQESDLRYVHNNLRYIQASGFYLSGLVDDLIDYSEVHSNRREQENNEYSLDVVMQKIADMCLVAKGERDIEVLMDIDVSIPRVLYGDEKKLVRVLTNVLDNAIRYTEKGGVFFSVTKNMEDGVANLIITIMDTGKGISKTKLQMIQNSIEENDVHKQKHPSGFGLGLLISYVNIKLMGGEFSIRSEEGKGTIVNIILPQKIIDEQPIVSGFSEKTICYVEGRQFEKTLLHNAYENMFKHLEARLDTRLQYCGQISEFEKHIREDDYKNIIVSVKEYEKYRKYFERLSERYRLIVLTDFNERNLLHEKNICLMKKPLCSVTLMQCLLHLQSSAQGDATAEKVLRINNAKIMIVDDNPVNLQILQKLLLQYEAQVVLAHSGKEAIKRVQKQDIDLIFMDHMMPEMNGCEAFHAIRALEGDYFKRVPVIALTANIVPGIRKEFMREGFQDFAEKPLESYRLLQILKAYLPEEKIDYRENTKNAPKEADGETEYTDKTAGGEFTLLDTASGETYCGNRENYYAVLEGYAKRGKKNYQKIQELFNEENWQDYTIEVHGIKSSLLAIGAKEISAKAKALESAGKEQRILFIREHHDDMIRMYREMISEIRKFFGMEDEQETSEKSSAAEINRQEACEPLSQEQVAELLQGVEDAAFSLERETLLSLGEQLKNHAYRDKNLNELYEEYIRKIEKEDYLSAYSLLSKELE